MALIVGMERGFISRAQGLAQLEKILGFLETCDRFHGAWPHWLNGGNGNTVPFSPNDNGADLVETSYMVEGLMTMRQYLDPGIPARLHSSTGSMHLQTQWNTTGSPAARMCFTGTGPPTSAG